MSNSEIEDIKTAIASSLSSEARQYFFGMAESEVNDLVIVAQREGIYEAAKEIESLARD